MAVIKFRPLYVYFISALLTASVCQAQHQYAASEQNPKDLFVNIFKFSNPKILPKPPAKGSVEEQADYELLKELERTRTEEDCKRAESEVKVSLASFFGPPYGTLTKEQVEKLEPLYKKIAMTTGAVTWPQKQYWGRPRPGVTFPLNLCIKAEKSFSYPSGHTTLARVLALALAKLEPSQKEVFEARAEQIGMDRVIGGVHHISDIKAGKIFADLIFKDMEKNPKFVAELKKYSLGEK